MAIKYDGTHGSNQSHGFLSGNAGPWTIMTWAKLVSTAAANAYVFQSAGAFNNAAHQTAIIFGFVSGQYELFSSDTGSLRTGSGITPGDTGWHHIAWRKQASGSSAYDKFLDGVKTSINASISFSFGALGFATLGSAISSGNPIDISLYRLFILEQALSDANIAAEAAATFSGPTFGANDGYWSFTNTTGTDDTGHGFDWGGATGTSLVANPSIFTSSGRRFRRSMSEIGTRVGSRQML